MTGHVLLPDGSPLVGARVIARSNATGRWASGMTDQDGHYELGSSEKGDGIEPGDYYVIIVEDRGDVDQRRPPSIPDRYSKEDKSGLQLSLTAGEQKVFDVKLDAK